MQVQSNFGPCPSTGLLVVKLGLIRVENDRDQGGFATADQKLYVLEEYSTTLSSTQPA